MTAADRAFEHRALHCAACTLPKHAACQCQPPELREVASARELREAGDYYATETPRPDHEYFDQNRRRRVLRNRVHRQFLGLVRLECGTEVPVAGYGTLEVYRANCLQAIQAGCNCRRGLGCLGRAVEELAAVAA